MSITDYGAFVEIEPGVEGLIHISEMTWSRRMKHPSRVVKAGDQVVMNPPDSLVSGEQVNIVKASLPGDAQ